MPLNDLSAYYRTAESLLAKSQFPEVRASLGECARRLLAAEEQREALQAFLSRQTGMGHLTKLRGAESADTRPWQGGSLEELVLRYEGDVIKQALEASGGSVTRAARLLGITHQGLAFILNGRQKALLSVRTPVKPRRRSIIRYQ